MITNDLNYYIKNFKGVINKDVCNNTVNELIQNNDKFEQHKFYNQQQQTSKALSGNKELDVTAYTPTTNKIFMDTIFQCLLDYMKYIKLPYFDGWSGYSAIRWNRYSETRKMAEHCDHIQSLFEGRRKGVPILSCLGSLNDDYKGGELVFFGNKTIEFKQGDLLIFPSNFLYPHRVEPVDSGIRWSYISWVW